MSERIRLVIFDLDGTLVDAYQAVSASLNHALGAFGYPSVPDETIKRSVGWGDKNLVSRFVPAEEVDRVLSVYRTHHRSALKSGTKFLPGAKALLEELKAAGFDMAIASNRPSRFTHIILKHLHAAGYFAAVVCADQVAAPKPAPDCLQRILASRGVAAQEAIYVGDMTIDVQTGRGAGVRTAAVLSGSSTEEEIRREEPQWIVRDLGGVRRLIKELSGP